MRVLRKAKWTGIAALAFSLASLSALPAAEPENKEWIEGLGSEQFADRETAQAELTEWAMADLDARADYFLGLMRTSEDPEIKIRCRAILKDAVLGGLEDSGPGFMGIVMSRIVARVPLGDEVVMGVGVDAVQPDTPAQKSGLQPGDLLVKVDELSLDAPDGSTLLQQYVTEVGAGNKIELSVVRDGKIEEVPLVLMRTPLQVEFLRRHPQRFGSPMPPSEEKLREMEFERWLEERLSQEEPVEEGDSGPSAPQPAGAKSPE